MQEIRKSCTMELNSASGRTAESKYICARVANDWKSCLSGFPELDDAEMEADQV